MTEGILVTVFGGLGIVLHLMAIYTMARGVTGSGREAIQHTSRIHTTGSPNETPPGKGRETDLRLPCWLQLTLLG